MKKSIKKPWICLIQGFRIFGADNGKLLHTIFWKSPLAKVPYIVLLLTWQRFSNKKRKFYETPVTKRNALCFFLWQILSHPLYKHSPYMYRTKSIYYVLCGFWFPFPSFWVKKYPPMGKSAFIIVYYYNAFRVGGALPCFLWIPARLVPFVPLALS